MGWFSDLTGSIGGALSNTLSGVVGGVTAPLFQGANAIVGTVMNSSGANSIGGSIGGSGGIGNLLGGQFGQLFGALGASQGGVNIQTPSWSANTGIAAVNATTPPAPDQENVSDFVSGIIGNPVRLLLFGGFIWLLWAMFRKKRR